MSSDPGPAALLSTFPALADRIPWQPLGHFPTPLQRIDHRFGHLLGPFAPGGGTLWVKRDDLCGGPYGGNKVRKLEFLLSDAARRGARRLLTIGAYGSNHVLATTVYGRRAGFDVDAVLFPQPLSARVFDQLLAEAHAGARLIPTRSYLGAGLAVARGRLRRGVYWIPAGGSSPLGVLGYVSAGLELAAQIRAGEAPPFDTIYVPLGSGSTAAGLWLGLALAGWAGRLIAVRVVDRIVANRTLVRWWAAGGARLLRRAGLATLPGTRPELYVDHRFFGPGYAHPTPAAEDAVAQAAQAGLTLETTYTGKTLAALLEDARAGRLTGQNVLFIDTFNSLDLAPLLPPARDPALLPPLLARLYEQYRARTSVTPAR
ncbi:MAG TPA: pyridoxal-phosphate dependent enzyme [Polyangia bacterium]|nr:pyridoxal-phosphate dependent enzyme [Polyangia bacterium]